MRFSKFLILVILSCAAVSFSTAPVKAWQRKAARHNANPISGEWRASLLAAGNSNEVALLLKLKLDGNKVTGSYESDHVGSGTINNGTWTANTLSLTLETNHGAITLNGDLKQGKLSGKFNSGPMQGTWQARRK